MHFEEKSAENERNRKGLKYMHFMKSTMRQICIHNWIIVIFSASMAMCYGFRVKTYALTIFTILLCILSLSLSPRYLFPGISIVRCVLYGVCPNVRYLAQSSIVFNGEPNCFWSTNVSCVLNWTRLPSPYLAYECVRIGKQLWLIYCHGYA